MTRISILTIAALSIAGLGHQPALAKDIGPRTKDAVEGSCNEKGGTFWATPDGASYGCGYKGGGGVICDKGGGNVGPWCEETKADERGGSRPPWGLAGLLGLIGLAGLVGRPRNRDERTADAVR